MTLYICKQWTGWSKQTRKKKEKGKWKRTGKSPNPHTHRVKLFRKRPHQRPLLVTDLGESLMSILFIASFLFFFILHPLLWRELVPCHYIPAGLAADTAATMDEAVVSFLLLLLVRSSPVAQFPTSHHSLAAQKKIVFSFPAVFFLF